MRNAADVLLGEHKDDADEEHDDIALPITHGKDDRIIIHGIAIGQHPRARDPIQHDRTDNPQHFRAGIERQHFLAADIERED